MGQRGQEFVLSAILFAQLMIEARQLLLIELLRGHIDRHPVEICRRAVARIIGTAERAYPLMAPVVGCGGAIDGVIGGASARPTYQWPSRVAAPVFLGSPLEVLNLDPSRRLEEKVLLDPVVPLQLGERQIAVPEAHPG